MCYVLIMCSTTLVNSVQLNDCFFLVMGLINKKQYYVFINLTSWGITKQNMFLNEICSGSNFMVHWKKLTIHFDISFILILCIELINVSKFWKISSKDHKIYLVQLSWNYYYFVQNLCFDDKMKIFEQFKFSTSKLQEMSKSLSKSQLSLKKLNSEAPNLNCSKLFHFIIEVQVFNKVVVVST